MAPAPVRVLVVDDAVVIRRLLGDIIEADPELDLVGVAANGRIALQRIDQLAPDIVTLDVEMPELDGIGTLRELRKTHPRLPVVMFSTLTERGAAATLDALALGAADYVTKPANVGSVTEAIERVRADLIPKLKALCGRPGSAGPAPSWALPTSAQPPAPVGPVAPAPGSSRLVEPGGDAAERAVPPVPAVAAPLPRFAPAVVARPAPSQRPEAVLIGSSTGGPNALADVLRALPGDLGVPVLIVQHMPPLFTTLLAQRLDAASPLRVLEAADGARVQPNTVLIAPGDHHLTVKRNLRDEIVAVLDQKEPENSCRPAVDPLFRSAASVWGGATLAVVLTGMGYDGMRGAESIRAAGGRVVAQDRETSVVWGMPGAVASAGLADAVLPIGRVAQAIVEGVRGRMAEAGAR